MATTRIKRESFLHALERISPGLSAKEIVEQSNCFIFQDGQLLAFNDEVCCRTRSPLNGVTGAVQAAPLLNLLGKLPEEEIQVEAKETELVIHGKKRRAGIRMDAEVTLPVGAVEQPKKWNRLPDDFTEAIKMVGACAGQDESQFFLTCIHLHPQWVEACDNFQLCRWRLETGISAPTLVRHSSVRPITALGVTEFAETPAWMHFRTPGKAGLTLSCRRYLEDYNDLTRLLKVKGTRTQLPKGLAVAADIAQVFSAEDPENNRVRLDLEADKVHVTGKGVSGWYTETRRLAYGGAPLAFLISPELLTVLVKNHSQCIVSPDRLKVKAGSYSYVACLIRPEEAGARDEEPGAEEEGDE